MSNSTPHQASGTLRSPIIPIPDGKKATKLKKWSNLSTDELARLMTKHRGNRGQRLDEIASLDPDSPAAVKLCETWEREGKLPPTWTYRTARGIVRRMYRRPAALTVPLTIKEIAFQLRTGPGMYDVIPPSRVKDPQKGIDGFYEWLPGLDPESIELADLPKEILEYFRTHAQPPHVESGQKAGPVGSEIPMERNNTLTSLAGSMRRRGMTQEEIEAALLVANQNRCKPPLPVTEVLAIAKSISRYAPGSQGTATGGTWPNPEPLRRLPEPGEPFPVEALGPILGDAAGAMHGIIKAPLAVCGQSVLATGNLAVQGHADVVIDGRWFPVSENLLSIADSGERKTGADKAALAPVDTHQRWMLEAYDRDFSQYNLETELWKKEHDDALRKPNPNARRAALEALPAAPTAPAYPQLTTEEPTYEGLVKLLAQGWPSVGLFSDEGGRFLGGHAMNQENRLKTLAGLSNLWDGKPISRTRGGDGAITLYGRRVCAHLLMQPIVAETILSDPLALNQGFLSRCLISAPESSLGTQTYVAKDLSIEASYGHYCARITQVLNAKLPFKIDPDTGKPMLELIPRKLPVSSDGKAIWIRFHDWVQEHLGHDGVFRPISGIAAKAAEHALRLAGTLSLVDDLNTMAISPGHVKAGIVLARFYLTEALRLFHTAKTNPDLVLAEKVLAWLRTRECPNNNLVSSPDVYQLGPNAVRDKGTARRILEILSDHGWVRLVEGGAEIAGKKRRQVWEVNPNV